MPGRLVNPAGGPTRLLRRLLADDGGASALEYTLLLAAIAIPMIGVFRIALALLIGHYQMMTFLNGWPFP